MITVPVPLLVLDPSSTKIGWAVLGEGPTCIHSDAKYMPAAPADERVPLVGEAVAEIVGECRGQGCCPALILIEMPDYIANKAIAQNIILYFRAVGAAEYAAHLCGLPVAYVKASRYKEGTRKEDAKERFRRHAGRHPKTDDESDAFCIGWDYLTDLMKRQRPAASHEHAANTWDGSQTGKRDEF